MNMWRGRPRPRLPAVSIDFGPWREFPILPFLSRHFAGGGARPTQQNHMAEAALLLVNFRAEIIELPTAENEA
jgi:hypothetical protein